ncbi:hypothetical protein [Methanobrevibacter filiformis]|uniref:Uncharacterized protein n=1 Tax=Methanobrevibacter filiformis TaxID=55758 RepID=A0A165ZIE5_9EURY|nr:hypothetical protein [Methanobrevibacter filiformis]KZX10776.1 hypothetical protein MBFIL_16100 [Methanobrevibacter filiformis]
MKKRDYGIIIGIIIVIVVAIILSSTFIFQEKEEGICKECQMLNCHEHATGDKYCCDMCNMEEGSKCDCDMPEMTSNSTMNTLNT